MADSFPRQYARTQRFTLGEPRDVSVSATGDRVVFLRSRGGDDPANCLWVADVTTGPDGTRSLAERLVVDPVALLADAPETLADLPAEERARRERRREGAGGITAYAGDAGLRMAAFTVGGRLFSVDLATAQITEVAVPGPVFDPRPDPTGARVAFVHAGALWVAGVNGSEHARVVAGERTTDTDSHTDTVATTVTWGAAEFIAAEEMQRMRGFWWAPEGDRVAVTRVDTAPVQDWYIADPADPASPARRISYPAAGTANAEVRLYVCALDPDVAAVEVVWDRADLPYLADVAWTTAGLLVTLQSRDQTRLVIARADTATGALEVLATEVEPRWVDLVPGVPRLVPGAPADEESTAALVWAAERAGTRVLLRAGRTVSRPDQVVRAVVAADAERVIYTANPLHDATGIEIWVHQPEREPVRISPAGAVCAATAGGDTLVVRTATLTEPQATWEVRTCGGREIGTLENLAETPRVAARPQIFSTPRRSLAVAVLLPRDHDGQPLPVLMDPYGGPHAQRVLRSHNAFATSQWFADQGFAVVVADGRGTPGRGTEFERAVKGDLAHPVLEDQIEALEHAAAATAALDLDRVAIRGWSFGGYLAALAVLARPDVFHAAIAGAPVTQWRLYDTHYTERYLGDPTADAAPYERTSLLPLAGNLRRPLLLIHGLADDNVVAAHTLQLSRALLEAGRPHEVLPLVGVSHMTPQEVVAENLLRHQLAFLRRALGVPAL